MVPLNAPTVFESMHLFIMVGKIASLLPERAIFIAPLLSSRQFYTASVLSSIYSRLHAGVTATAVPVGGASAEVSIHLHLHAKNTSAAAMEGVRDIARRCLSHRFGFNAESAISTLPVNREQNNRWCSKWLNYSKFFMFSPTKSINSERNTW